MTERLVLSISEAAHALGVSDDLIYELTNRGELPCLQFGGRKVIPQQAIDSVIELALCGFDPGVLLVTLDTRINHSPVGSAATWTSAPPAQ